MNAQVDLSTLIAWAWVTAKSARDAWFASALVSAPKALHF
jgi:hypothetical protein